MISDATIVPPTSQNQKTIEEDLRAFVPDHANLPEEQLKWRCEQASATTIPAFPAQHML